MYLDRNVAAALTRAPDLTESSDQKQDVAAFHPSPRRKSRRLCYVVVFRR